MKIGRAIKLASGLGQVVLASRDAPSAWPRVKQFQFKINYDESRKNAIVH